MSEYEERTTENELLAVSGEMITRLVQRADAALVLTDETGEVRFANPLAEKLLGRGKDGLIGTRLSVKKGESEQVRVAMQDGESPPQHVEISVITSEWEGQLGRLLVVQDINLRQKKESALAHDAMHDTLTGLPNRALFLDRLERCIRGRSRKTDVDSAVMFLDLDNFKFVNDSLGHQAGDDLLIQASARLLEAVRATDTVARFGGDEFAVLLEELKQPGIVISIAERILTALRTPFQLADGPAEISGSIGMVMLGEKHDNAEKLLEVSDAAMYAAKADGKGQWRFFDGDLEERQKTRIRYQSHMVRALESNQFRVHYQPIISLDTGTVSGAEALVRWQHPEDGMLSPGVFIPIAEEVGLADQIDWWVFQTTCLQLTEWRLHVEQAGLTVAVNLSANAFLRTELPERIGAELARLDLAPSALHVEIVESGIMKNIARARTTLKAMRDLGIKLSLDDFGTGYSSLSHLREFPLDAVKVDRSFVSRIGHGKEDLEIVRAIVELGHNLGLKVVAEGVEDEEQLKILRELGCDFCQGYFFSPPLAAPEFFSLVSTNPSW